MNVISAPILEDIKSKLANQPRNLDVQSFLK